MPTYKIKKNIILHVSSILEIELDKSIYEISSVLELECILSKLDHATSLKVLRCIKISGFKFDSNGPKNNAKC